MPPGSTSERERPADPRTRQSREVRLIQGHWVTGTSYDGNSFFVRHAYFCGDNEPYESLMRALRVDIDEEACNSLCRTTSRPFPAPGTGRIAVKVINHYGDEVIKVLEAGTSSHRH